MPEREELEKLQRQLEAIIQEQARQKVQLKGMVYVTQAINENVGADELFEKLGNFLNFEMQLQRHVLLFCEHDEWRLVSHHQADLRSLDLAQIATELTRLGSGRRKLNNEQHPFIAQFAYGLQVFHKETPLAYLFMGQLTGEGDVWGQLDIVTAATNVVAVAIENKRMFKEQVNRKVLDHEIVLAAEIQQTLIPSRLPEGQLYGLSSIYRPHFAVGGDYFDVVEFPDGKLAFCIADITGKGMAAALLMANFQANFYSLITRQLSLEETVQGLNAAVHRVTAGDRFITLFLGKYDPATRTLHFVNSGHTPPFLIVGEQVIRLTNGTTILGFLPELPDIDVGGICLTTDATLFTYTDGLTDLRNPAGDDFSDELLEEFLLSHAKLPARTLNARLLDHIDRFRQNQPYPDDITVLTCRIFDNLLQ
jgi:phosphoserine phosphatase RsbU/P